MGDQEASTIAESEGSHLELIEWVSPILHIKPQNNQTCWSVPHLIWMKDLDSLLEVVWNLTVVSHVR